jgi:hypothetical protein
MAARKPTPKKKAAPAAKKKSAPAPQPTALGNDPFKKGAATRAVVGSAPGGPPPRPASVPTPELQRAARKPVLQPIAEKPRGGRPGLSEPVGSPGLSEPVEDGPAKRSVPAPKVTPIRPAARAAADAPRG